MIYGNHTQYSQLMMLITKLLTDPQQEIYPFILVAGPAHIGKSSIVHDIVVESGINPYDIVTLQDLSDDRGSLKESNELAGSFHTLQLDVETKRQDIKLDDGAVVHNRGIRELQDRLVRSPLGSDKVVVIEAIERATGGSANALLKTLEEPLAHRLIIATTHSLAQLPATIISRAMIFHMDKLPDDEMSKWVDDYLPDVTNAVRQSLLSLAAGRPGLLVLYHRKGMLDEIVQSWISVQTQIKSGPIAILYQQMSAINKAGYLSLILDALLQLGDYNVYRVTLDLISKMDSNVNIDNLLFERCMHIVAMR